MSQFSAEGLVQQRLLQFVERGELAMIEGGEAAGFFRQFVESLDNFELFCERRHIDRETTKICGESEGRLARWKHSPYSHS